MDCVLSKSKKSAKLPSKESSKPSTPSTLITASPISSLRCHRVQTVRGTRLGFQRWKEEMMLISKMQLAGINEIIIATLPDSSMGPGIKEDGNHKQRRYYRMEMGSVGCNYAAMGRVTLEPHLPCVLNNLL